MSDTDDQATAVANTEETIEAQARTEQLPQPEAPQAIVQSASLGDVARTAGSFARGRAQRLREFFATHILAAGIVAACALLAVFGGVLYARTLANVPSAETIEQDVRSRINKPNYAPGRFGGDDQLTLSHVELLGRHKEAGTPNECAVTVACTYTNASVECTERNTLGYELKDGAWSCVEVSKPTDVVYTAHAGVADRNLVSGIDAVLSKAEAGLSSTDEGASGSMSLLTLYRNADITVTERAFDEAKQTYDVSMHLAHASTFTAHECDVSASFSFRPGTGVWELTRAAASKDAKDLVFSPLVGTWQGSFLRQSADDGKCFGAKDAGITVVVTSVDGDRISGTISGIAHYHAGPDHDIDADEGDTEVQGVQFSGKHDPSAGGIAFDCTTPEDSRGTLALRLVFGTEEDPAAALATLTTVHTYEATFLFVAYDRTATYQDTFSLTRQ